VAKSGIASEEAGVQGAASPLPEREVSSPPPFSLPPQAAKQDFATALIVESIEVAHFLPKPL